MSQLCSNLQCTNEFLWCTLTQLSLMYSDFFGSHVCVSGEISLEWGTASDCLVMMEEEKSPALGLSATDTLWSTTTTSDKMLNTSDCQQPWEDFVETKETKLDIFIFICLSLTIVFDTFLVAIVLLRSDLRKKAIPFNSNRYMVTSFQIQRINHFMSSICISDMAFAVYLIALCQPGICFHNFFHQHFRSYQGSIRGGTQILWTRHFGGASGHKYLVAS